MLSFYIALGYTATFLERERNDEEMKELRFISESVAATVAFGQALGRAALPGDMICLDGDLGAGKTALSQAIAAGLEVSPEIYVTSPSFAIFHEYPARLPIYHMDFYRLEGYRDIEDLGFAEYFMGSGVCVVEWALRAKELLPEDRLHLFLEIDGVSTRNIICKYSRQKWGKRLAIILKESDCGPGHWSDRAYEE